MNWLPFALRIDATTTPEKARAICTDEVKAGRLVSVCSKCQADDAALRLATGGFVNLSHGYCESHFASVMRELDAWPGHERQVAA